MPTREHVLGEIQFNTTQLSTQFRTLVLSIFAVTWLFLIKGEDGPPLQLVDGIDWVIGLAIVCLTALSLDMLQYLFGWLDSKRLLNQAETDELKEILYDTGALFYRARSWCFRGKLTLLLIAFVWGIVLLGRAIAAT